MSAQFVEVLIAPGYTPDALAVIGQKKNVRVLEVALPPADAPAQLDFKRIGGGLLLQNADARNVAPAELKVVTAKAPTAGAARAT